jgi:hypothetical protein
MKRRTSRRKLAVGILAVVLAVGALGVFIYVNSRQGILAERFRIYLTERLSESFGLEVQIGTISGDVWGTVSLRDVRISMPNPSAPALTIFTCGEIRFRYTLLDFLRQNFTGWFDVILNKPVFYANAPFGARAPEAHSVEIFSGLTQRVHQTARLIIHDGTIAWLGQEGTLSGIDGMIANRSFDLTITLNHLKMGNFDATTTLVVDGQLAGDDSTHALHLVGSAATRGTVINWKPLPSESRMHFDLSRDTLKIWDSEILGGIAVEGSIGHTSRQEVDLTFTAKGYPLKEMHDIFSFSGSQAIGGQMTGKLRIAGAVTEPRLIGECVIGGNDAPGSRFKAMQLFFEGIYPQVKISRSQMILSNGNAMQFSSEQEIGLFELFNADTYERLIARSEQRTVTWHDWTLYREGEKDSLSMERPLDGGTNAAEKEDSGSEGDEASGLDTLFGGKESFKVELKDDEQILALQKKSQF